MNLISLKGRSMTSVNAKPQGTKVKKYFLAVPCSNHVLAALNQNEHLGTLKIYSKVTCGLVYYDVCRCKNCIVIQVSAQSTTVINRIIY